MSYLRGGKRIDTGPSHRFLPLPTIDEAQEFKDLRLPLFFRILIHIEIQGSAQGILTLHHGLNRWRNCRRTRPFTEGHRFDRRCLEPDPAVPDSLRILSYCQSNGGRAWLRGQAFLEFSSLHYGL